MKLILFPILLLFFTCQNPGTSNTNSMETENTILMKQNTVTTIEGVRIGNGNYFDRDYELKDGTTQNGLAARLFFPNNNNIVVGKGSVFSVNEQEFQVIDIGKQLKDKPYGFIRIQEVK